MPISRSQIYRPSALTPQTAGSDRSVGAVGQLVETAEASPGVGFTLGGNIGANIANTTASLTQSVNVSSTVGALVVIGGVLYAADKLL